MKKRLKKVGRHEGKTGNRVKHAQCSHRKRHTPRGVWNSLEQGLSCRSVEYAHRSTMRRTREREREKRMTLGIKVNRFCRYCCEKCHAMLGFSLFPLALSLFWYSDTPLAYLFFSLCLSLSFLFVAEEKIFN